MSLSVKSTKEALFKEAVTMIIEDKRSLPKYARAAFDYLHRNTVSDDERMRYLAILRKNHPSVAVEIEPTLDERFVRKDLAFAVDGFVST